MAGKVEGVETRAAQDAQMFVEVAGANLANRSEEREVILSRASMMFVLASLEITGVLEEKQAEKVFERLTQVMPPEFDEIMEMASDWVQGPDAAFDYVQDSTKYAFEDGFQAALHIVTAMWSDVDLSPAGE